MAVDARVLPDPRAVQDKVKRVTHTIPEGNAAMNQTLTDQLDISPADVRRRARLIVISGIVAGCLLIGLDHSLTAFLPTEKIPLLPAIASLGGLILMIAVSTALMRTLGDLTDAALVERVKQANSALAESEERFRGLFETSPDAMIYRRKGTNGSMQLVNVNDAYLDMFGYQRSDIDPSLGNGQRMSPDSRRRWNEEYAPILESKGFVDDMFFDVTRTDGTTFPVIARAMSISNSDGEVIATWTTLRDVSQQVHAEQDLRLKNRALEQSSSAIAIYRTGSGKNTITYVNPAYEDMTGFTADDFKNGNPVRFIADTNTDQTELTRLRTAKENGEPSHARLWSTKKDGTRILRDIISSPVRNDNGDITHWVSVSHDVTQKIEDEQQLRLFKRAVEQASNSIAILEQTSSGAKAVYINPAFEKMTGFTLASLKVRNKDFHATPAGKPDNQEQFQNGFLTGTAVHGQRWATNSDGSAQLRDIENSPVRNENGDVTHWISVTRDITKEVEDQQKLHLFKRAMEQSPTAITIVQDQDGEIPRIAFVNDSIERMHGFSKEAMVGQSADVFVPEGHISPELAGTLKEARLRGETVDTDGYFKRPDGSDGWLSMRYAPVRDGSDTITHWVSYGADITEQHDAEVSRRRNAAILEQLTDTVFLSGLDGIILDCNQVSARTLGRSRDEIIGHKLSSFGADPEEQNRTARSRSKTALTSGEFTNEIPLVSNTGEIVLLEFSTKLMLNDMGQPEGWISVGRDITEKRAAEKELRILKRAIEQSPSAVTISEVQDEGEPRIVFGNEAVLSMHGQDSGVKVGQEVSTFVASHMIADDLGQRLRAARKRGEAVDTSGAYRRADGTDGWMNTRYAPVRDEQNKITHWIAFGTDITEQHQAERQRRILERALEHSPTAVSIIETMPNKVVKTAYVNAAFEKMTGYTREDVLNQPFSPVCARPSAKIESFVTQSSRGSGQGIEERVRADGSTYMREYRSSAVQDEQGATTHYIVLSNDITARIENEQQLRNLQMAFEQADSAISVMTVGEAGHQIAFVNSAFEKMTGYPRKEVIGRTAGFIKNRDFHTPGAMDNWRKSVQQGDSTSLTIETQRKDGSWFVRDMEANPVRGSDGAIVSWIGVSRDVTQKLRDEQRLRRDALVLETLGEAVTFTDPEGVFLDCNKAAETLFGYTKEELIGKPTEYVLKDPKTQGIEHSGRVARALEGKTTEGWDTILRKDGEERLIELVAAPFTSNDGKFLGHVTVSRDITDKRALQEQLQHAQKMEAVGQLTGGIAHDFNNLMGVISGSLQLIESEQEDWEFVHQIARTADKSVTRGKDLVDRMLSFSRKQNLDPIETSLAELLDETVDLLRRSIGDRINITLEHDSDLPPCLLDQAQFESAILNMSLNARDAMDPGGHLTISARQAVADKSGVKDATENRDYVCVTIADDGIGMDEATLAKIYEPFFTTKDVGQGSGLGLSMVYGFVKQSGGHIEVESTPGEGTQFSLFFPAMSTQHAGKTDALEAPLNEASNSRGRILVVEDNAEMMVISRLSLTRMGYDVFTADSSAAAMTQLSDNPDIKIAFIDIMLPDGMTGTELAKLLISVRPELRVLFTSGYSDPSILQDAMDISQVIRKPFTLKGLEDALSGLVEEPKPLN